MFMSCHLTPWASTCHRTPTAMSWFQLFACPLQKSKPDLNMAIVSTEILSIFAHYLVREVTNYCFCSPSTGWLQSTLQAELNPAQEQEPLHVQLADAKKPKPKYEEGQGVDAVIRRLESRVPDPALRPHEYEFQTFSFFQTV